MWYVGYLDDNGHEQTIGFAHTPQAATALAESFLMDRDLEFIGRWRKQRPGEWSVTIEDITMTLTAQ